MMAGAGRELAIAERTQDPAQRCLAHRDPELLPDPQPGHQNVDGRGEVAGPRAREKAPPLAVWSKVRSSASRRQLRSGGHSLDARRPRGRADFDLGFAFVASGHGSTCVVRERPSAGPLKLGCHFSETLGGAAAHLRP